MQKRVIVSTVIIALILMASCDNAGWGQWLHRRIKETKKALEDAKQTLEDASETGLKMLSQKAVEAAKAVVALKSSAAADDAVAKAQAVKTAIDKANSPSAQFEINAAVNEVDPTTPLASDEAKIEDYNAIQAAKTQVDELKKLADAAVAAAEAVQ